MELLYKGKTKDVLYDPSTGDRYLLFKDSATGEDGCFDPGCNTVGGSVAGKGKIGLAISKHFFELMEKNDVPTHYLGADIDSGLMKVRAVDVPKLEFVLRYYTAGSMCRRFTLESGLVFDPPYAEVTLKDDEQGDPLISDRICQMKGILREGEYGKALELLTKVGDILKSELKSMDFTLIDFKIEIGFDENRNLYVADEITPDIWRVQDPSGVIHNQIDCAALIVEALKL